MMGAGSTRNMYSNLAEKNKYDCLKLHHVGYLIKLYTYFGHPLSPSSGVLYCTFGAGKFHAGFDDSFQAESGWNCSSIHGATAVLCRVLEKNDMASVNRTRPHCVNQMGKTHNGKDILNA
jgi:hypothetical protein